MKRFGSAILITSLLTITLSPSQGFSAEVPTRTEYRSSGQIGSAWTDDRNPIWQTYTTKHLSLWSLKVPVRPAVPHVPSNEWVRNPIDAFILQKLTDHKLTPARAAKPSVLFRRLSFDTHGLPPDPHQIQRFVANASSGKTETEIERLLASPRFGEHWARHWLDVVRYAETNGYERDEFRPSLWRYRDYVINAFNSDLPYDQFLREQLAGDEFATRPLNETSIRQLIATGYLRLGPHDTTQEIFSENARGREQFLNDLVNTTGSAFLGMTFSCCQCHDHKTDPLLQEDHRRLQAFFSSLQFDDDVVVELPDREQQIRARNEPIDLQIDRVKKQLRNFLNQRRTQLIAELTAGFPPDIRRLLDLPRDQHSETDRLRLLPYQKRLRISDREVFDSLEQAERTQCLTWKEEIESLTQKKEPIAVAVGVRDRQPTMIASRRARKPLPPAPAAQPRSLVRKSGPGLPTMFEPQPFTTPVRSRTTLANWIVSERNPLTARVIVNRIWQHYFGVGLVATPNDFGASGSAPSHPELLDWLAVELMEHDWSLKHIHRLILNSATYQQASTVREDAKQLDPQNTLLWRQNLKRLEAETLRDAMLSVSGSLLPKHSGKPIWPVVPDELLVAQPGILAAIKKLNEGRKQGWYADPLESGDVRSIFLIHKRGLRPPFLQPFDVPDLSESCGRRDRTTGPPQALTLLNSEWTERMALAFAQQLTREVGSNPEQQIDLAFQRAFGRHPSPEERTASLAYLQTLRDPSTDTEHTAPPELVAFCRALFNFSEFLYID